MVTKNKFCMKTQKVARVTKKKARKLIGASSPTELQKTLSIVTTKSTKGYSNYTNSPLDKLKNLTK